ncbi:MAG: hypothetical protein AB1499_15470 [Nitrospirota bacterium]
MPTWDLQRLTLKLDANTHYDFAEKLIPRAVGYSAALLNYFFRGDIEPVYPEEVFDGNGGITGLRFTIKNTTPGESLMPQIHQQTGRNESRFVVSAEYRIGDQAYYALSNEVMLSGEVHSGGESSEAYVFTFGTAIPSGATSVRYWLVYKGTLGSEVNAVIGKAFFESLAVLPPDGYVYSITDGGTTPLTYTSSTGITSQHQQFTHIKAKVKITLLRQEIQGGSIQATARYRMRKDYQPDLSADPPAVTARQEELSFSASAPVQLGAEDIAAFNALDARQFTFDFSGSPIPAGITDLHLAVAIRSNDQQQSVIASGEKDLLEPVHHVIWNLTDMFSLNYHLYTSGEIRNSSVLSQYTDINGNGIFNEAGEPYIDPYQINVRIAYGPNPLPETPLEPVVNAVVPAGRHIRPVFLLDRDQRYSALRLAWTDPAGAEESSYDLAFEGGANQETGGTWTMTPVSGFRVWRDSDGWTEKPFFAHLHQGVVRCQPFVVEGQCVYLDAEALSAEKMPYPVNLAFP